MALPHVLTVENILTVETKDVMNECDLPPCSISALKMLTTVCLIIKQTGGMEEEKWEL